MIRKSSALLLFAVLLIGGCGGDKPTEISRPVGLISEGSRAPDFTITDSAGTVHTLSALAGTPVVLNFWASWCPPCRKEMPWLRDAAQRYKGKIQFLGINIQDSEKAFLGALSEFALPYPNGRDTEGLAAQSYGVLALPKTFFIGADGIVAYVHAGAIDEVSLEAAIRKIAR